MYQFNELVSGTIVAPKKAPKKIISDSYPSKTVYDSLTTILHLKENTGCDIEDYGYERFCLIHNMDLDPDEICPGAIESMREILIELCQKPIDWEQQHLEDFIMFAEEYGLISNVYL